MSVSQSKPYPQSVIKEKVDSTEEFADKTNLEGSIEYDAVVRMPPKKRYFVEIDVRDIIKAKPKVVLPEAI
jgi:CO/xanthine dehydrogenase Mo-binding subunit